ncbi:hypothetical protein IFM89_006694, partial [Coptis chinensis]
MKSIRIAVGWEKMIQSMELGKELVLFPTGKDLTKCPSKSSPKRSRANLIAKNKKWVLGVFYLGRIPSHVTLAKRRPGIVMFKSQDRGMTVDPRSKLRSSRACPKWWKGCSIDSLLDQTIKHMLFLRSVTNRKFKAVVDKKNLELFEDQGKENGASWAVEMGSQLEVCPIVVKDLEQPGHMLIE